MAGADKSDAAVAFAITILIFSFSLLRQVFDQIFATPFPGTIVAAVVIFFIALGIVKWYRGG